MIRILTILIAALAIAGCADSEQEGIAGAWLDPDDKSIARFSEDGSLSVGGDGSDDISGNYTLLEDNQMRLDLTYPGVEPISVVVTYELRGDTLILIAPDGDKTRMTRVDR